MKHKNFFFYNSYNFLHKNDILAKEEKNDKIYNKTKKTKNFYYYNIYDIFLCNDNSTILIIYIEEHFLKNLFRRNKHFKLYNINNNKCLFELNQRLKDDNNYGPNEIIDNNINSLKIACNEEANICIYTLEKFKKFRMNLIYKITITESIWLLSKLDYDYNNKRLILNAFSTYENSFFYIYFEKKAKINKINCSNNIIEINCILNINQNYFILFGYETDYNIILNLYNKLNFTIIKTAKIKNNKKVLIQTFKVNENYIGINYGKYISIFDINNYYIINTHIFNEFKNIEKINFSTSDYLIRSLTVINNNNFFENSFIVQIYDYNLNRETFEINLNKVSNKMKINKWENIFFCFNDLFNSNMLIYTKDNEKKKFLFLSKKTKRNFL